jgi:hypothetical protein
MVWVLHNGAWDWTIFEPSDEVDALTLRDFSDTGSALSFLQDLRDDPFSMAVLRELVAEKYGSSDLSNRNDHRLLELVAWELETGRLRVAGVFRPLTIGGKAHAPAEGEAEEPAPEPAAPATGEKTWIKFEILDDETGQPIQGVTLAVKLPDGTIKNSKTDGSGMIEIRDIDPGSCSIESMTDSDALEVLSIT